jgi:Bacterial extracellular solute-binding proteins, family 3
MNFGHISGELQHSLDWFNANQGVLAVLSIIIAIILPILGWLFVGSKNIGIEKRTATQKQLAQKVDESTLDEILATKRLKVGILDYPPLMSFKTSELGIVQASGIYPRILQKLADEEGLSLDWEVLLWSDITNAIKQGRVHVVASIFWTSRRSEHATFCGLMHRIGVTALVRSSEGRVKTHEDLKRQDIRIGLVRGEIGWEYASDMLNLGFEPRKFMVLDQVDIQNPAKLVENGLVDVMLADSLSCWLAVQAAQTRNVRLKRVFTKDQLYTCDNGLMIKRDDIELKKWFDLKLRKLRSDPELVREEEQDLRPLRSIVKMRNP